MVRSTIFETNSTQAVHLPKQVAFPDSIREVEIIVVGQSRIVSPLGKRWDDLFAGGPRASADFTVERPQPAAKDRKSIHHE